jgi:hypothetical protein
MGAGELLLLQGDQMICEKIAHLKKSSPNSLEAKKYRNIYNKTHLESPKHLHQTLFEPLKYLQQSMFWKGLFGWNLLKQKVAQNFAISLGYFIFSKNHDESPKVAQFGEK